MWYHASWHKGQTLEIPENIQLAYIPPYIPEMNTIEQIWKEIRTNGKFKNKLFPTLNKVIDQLEKAVGNLTNETVKSITNRIGFRYDFNIKLVLLKSYEFEVVGLILIIQQDLPVTVTYQQ